MTIDTYSDAAANANQAQVGITVNGAAHTLTVRHHWSLLDVLRDALQLTGAKRGCYCTSAFPGCCRRAGRT